MGIIKNKRTKEQGASALLVVIFSVLLLMTVSLGFLRLVIRDQQRTIEDELSRGAYDAALAGVEDGKRILQACVGNGNADACAAITANKCNSVHTAKILSSTDNSTNEAEVFIKSGSVSTAADRAETYDQAYTCVKVQRDTDAYERNLLADTSQVIPLNTLGGFNQVDVSWYQPPALTPLELNSLATPLPARDSWASVGSARPPILRVQLIQFSNSGFSLDDFDINGGGHTLYLYPSNIGGTAFTFDALDNRRHISPEGLLELVRCNAAATPYICNVRLSLPAPVNGSDATRSAYLRVTAIYGDTNFRVSAVGTKLHDVQPAIDSTGRASDVFRRVKANVELESPFDIYPRATVDITKNFCKSFSVSPTAYSPGGCDPTMP